MSKVRFGIVGIGNQGTYYANVLKENKIDNGILSALCDNNPSKLENAKVNTIAMDSNFSPIERVNYEVEGARVGQDDTYDKLTMEVWTDGSMKPEEAVALASRIII